MVNACLFIITFFLLCAWKTRCPLWRFLGKKAPGLLCPFHSQRSWWERTGGTRLECLTLSRQILLLYLQDCMGELYVYLLTQCSSVFYPLGCSVTDQCPLPSWYLPGQMIHKLWLAVQSAFFSLANGEPERVRDYFIAPILASPPSDDTVAEYEQFVSGRG